MLAERPGPIDMDLAFGTLREYARGHNRLLAEVARDFITASSRRSLSSSKGVAPPLPAGRKAAEAETSRYREAEHRFAARRAPERPRRPEAFRCSP